jgi:hypothetical protein
MRGVLLARIGSEGEFQAGPFCRGNEVLVGGVRHFVDFNGDLSGLCEIDDALGPLVSSKLRILPSDRNREKCGPREDVDGLRGQQLLDEVHVGRHEFLAVVHHGVNLPDGLPAALGTGQRERIHQNVVQLIQGVFREIFRPACIDGLQTNANRVLAQAIDVLSEVRIVLDFVAWARMIHDTNADLALFAELHGLLDRQFGTQVDMIVRPGKPGLPTDVEARILIGVVSAAPAMSEG